MKVTTELPLLTTRIRVRSDEVDVWNNISGA